MLDHVCNERDVAHLSANALQILDAARCLHEYSVGARIPVGRIGTGDEIAQAVVFIAANGFVTGQTIAVNGGSLFS